MNTVTIWVCVDCYISHNNGDDLPGTWAKLDPAHVTAGMTSEAHSCDTPNTEDCDCEHENFSRFNCEACGDSLAGERHAMTYWEDN